MRFGHCYPKDRGPVRRRSCGRRGLFERDTQKGQAESPGRIEWLQADIAGWQPECAPNLIYSNATLHWLDNHATLLPKLLGFLAPGGCLAVQVPLSHSLPSHMLMGETLANGGVNGSRLGDEGLAALVARSGCSKPRSITTSSPPHAANALDIWETDYFLRLEGDDPVLEWVKATGLRRILILNGLRGDDLKRFTEV